MTAAHTRLLLRSSCTYTYTHSVIHSFTYSQRHKHTYTQTQTEHRERERVSCCTIIMLTFFLSTVSLTMATSMHFKQIENERFRVHLPCLSCLDSNCGNCHCHGYSVKRCVLSRENVRVPSFCVCMYLCVNARTRAIVRVSACMPTSVHSDCVLCFCVYIVPDATICSSSCDVDLSPSISVRRHPACRTSQQSLRNFSESRRAMQARARYWRER